MKKLSKVLVLVLSAIMVLAMSATSFAVTVDSGNEGDASITITLPTQQQAPTGTTTYKLYKVFDATSDGESDAISYTARHNAALPTGFVKDSAGNIHHGTIDDEGNVTDDKATDLTEAEIAAIAAYVRDPADLVYTATVPAGETSVTVTGLEYGYYYITTSTGTVVTVDSTNPTANVDDKNIIPKVVKSAGTQYDEDSLKAIAAVGTDQPFTAQINVGKGAKNLVFTDAMTNMTYNGDVKVTVGGSEVAPSTTVNTDAANETYTISGVAGDTTFTLTFDNDYVATLAENAVITINYSGKVTSDALSTNPATNTATITSGDGNTSTSEEIKVYNAKFTVTKQDGDEQPLAGAGFVVAKTVADTSEGAEEGATKTVYYKLADDKKSISWVDSIDDATEYTSNAQGAVPAFTGLGDGTYTLIEKTVPAGYNKAADSTFTVAGNDYTAANLEQTATVTNESGAELPSTGGIGTTIFYILGTLLVVGCGIVLVSRKRMEKNN